MNTDPHYPRTDTPYLLRLLAVVAACAAVVLLDGCATAPPPVEQMAVAEAAVQRANTASTTENAAAELGIAVNKLARARSAQAAGDNLTARRLADEAVLDAQVAELHAQTMRSTKAARETEDAARVLREEIARKAPASPRTP